MTSTLRYEDRSPRAVLIGPGDIAESGIRERERDRWIAIDGGVDRCLELGRKPDLAIGDWDSVGAPARRRLRGIPSLTLPRDKDRSDYFHALLAAVELGFERVEGFGLTGGRPDHHWAVMTDSAEAVASGRLKRVHLVGPEAEYYVFAGELTMTLPRGAIVSVFALESVARGVTLEGLRYPLKGAELRPSSRGLSNWAVRGSVSIRCRQGVLMAILPAR